MKMPLANKEKLSSSTARQVPESQHLHANYSKHYQCHSGTFRFTTSAIPTLYRWLIKNMPTLILVKHSLPKIDTTVPANQWRLSEAGRSRARRLAQKLRQYSLDLIFSSVEPKAIETAQIVGNALDKPVEVVEGVHEHDRRNVKFLDKKKFEESVAQFFAQPDVLTFGNETADQAYHRFSQAVTGISTKYSDSNLVFITHGTVLTLFVSRLTAIAPFPFWKDLELPSWVVLSHPSLELIKVFKSIDTPE